MRTNILTTGVAFAAAVAANPASAAADQKVPAAVLNKFKNPEVVTSNGGRATCVQGTIAVTASTSSNVKIDFAIPTNQTVVTDTFMQFLQINSSLVASVSKGPATVQGTYNIFSRLCYPKGGSIDSSSVQFLIHGIGISSTYWDFAPGYSYVDGAADAGYTTFSYDRLGVGQSDHPDPINVVQAPFELAIAHTMIGGLRSGDLTGVAFKKVIGAGQSFGSIQTQALTYHYPADLDAAILTGFTSVSPGLPSFLSGLNSVIARNSQPKRFQSLNNGYMVLNAAMGNQFAFFRFPNYDPTIFSMSTVTKAEYTFGEFFTAGTIAGVASNFTKPVAIVNGEADWPFCQGNCLYPSDLGVATLKSLYPNAASSSKSYMFAGVGHALNLHYEACTIFEQIQKFIKANGF